ncbi:hypothetical protein AVEN_125676-1 [Araneus ventricosus]|uniref:Uncharacterized protein n=1 Tax=Araneus ventricosus TaxID=182803 RepID=A0A4Y2KZY7_ARAVE|nr:hypothetical protein AVEN_125676-1 [Araneus ventricosus]
MLNLGPTLWKRQMNAALVLCSNGVWWQTSSRSTFPLMDCEAVGIQTDVPFLRRVINISTSVRIPTSTVHKCKPQATGSLAKPHAAPLEQGTNSHREG